MAEDQDSDQNISRIFAQRQPTSTVEDRIPVQYIHGIDARDGAQVFAGYANKVVFADNRPSQGTSQ